MVDLKNLRWSDLKSPTIGPDEYLEKIKDKTYLIKNYENYSPKSKIVNAIKEFVLNNQEKLKILAIGADWCPDSSRNVPGIVKLIKEMKNIDIELHILYGVKSDYSKKNKNSVWDEENSPPEATDPKFGLKNLPTFYFFNKKGNYLGRIVENPKKFSTLEEDLLNILKRSKG